MKKSAYSVVTDFSTLHSTLKMRPKPHFDYFFISLMITCMSAVLILPSPLRS